MIEHQAADPDMSIFVLLVTIQQPVLAAVRACFQIYNRVFEPHLGQDDIPAKQLGQIDGDFHGVCRNHLPVSGPWRIRERHAFGAQARSRPAQLDRHVSLDREFATGFFQCRSLDRAAQPIPVEQRNEQGYQQQ